MATIKDVAKLAKVSTATVSRVLNNTGYVNVETKKRVNEAIEHLNYRPNDVARSLFNGRSKMIALFVPDIMNPFFPELARAVEDVTNENGYTFILCNTDNDFKKETTYLDVLQQKSVDGIILVSSRITERNLVNINVPVVALDRVLSTNMSSITVNNRQGAREATNLLQSIGCKRIAHLSGPVNVSNTLSRMQGYLDVVQDEDWFNSAYIVSAEYNMSKAFQVTQDLLKEHPEIDGLFVANDLMGIGALKAAKSMGISVPEDLSIIAFDGIALGEITSPSLSTMQQPIYKMGARAAEILIEHINNPNDSIKREEFEVELIERESTKKLIKNQQPLQTRK